MAAAQDERLIDLLRAKGVSPTRQRVELLAELAEEPNDITAQELWTRLRRRSTPGVGLTTVYRTLALLREHGVVDTLAHHDTELCYRLCSDTHHHHLVCRTCHRVIELNQCTLGDWINQLAEQHGFAALDHTLEVEGLCSDCQTDR